MTIPTVYQHWHPVKILQACIQIIYSTRMKTISILPLNDACCLSVYVVIVLLWSVQQHVVSSFLLTVPHTCTRLYQVSLRSNNHSKGSNNKGIPLFGSFFDNLFNWGSTGEMTWWCHRADRRGRAVTHNINVNADITNKAYQIPLCSRNTMHHDRTQWLANLAPSDWLPRGVWFTC